MMFVQCTVPSVRYMHGKSLNNDPVNLAYCKRIRKSTYNWYPDNDGLPTIEFKGCGARWVFDSTEDRDKEFDRVLQLAGSQPP